jgi:hypothetical protein
VGVEQAALAHRVVAIDMSVIVRENGRSYASWYSFRDCDMSESIRRMNTNPGGGDAGLFRSGITCYR